MRFFLILQIPYVELRTDMIFFTTLFLSTSNSRFPSICSWLILFTYDHIQGVLKWLDHQFIYSFVYADFNSNTNFEDKNHIFIHFIHWKLFPTDPNPE